MKCKDPKQGGCHRALQSLDLWYGPSFQEVVRFELQVMNARMLAFSNHTHKFGLYEPLVHLSFVRKGVGKSHRVCCLNKMLKVLLFRLHFRKHLSELLEWFIVQTRTSTDEPRQ